MPATFATRLSRPLLSSCALAAALLAQGRAVAQTVTPGPGVATGAAFDGDVTLPTGVTHSADFTSKIDEFTINTPTAVLNWTATGSESGGQVDFLPSDATAIFQGASNFVVLNRITHAGGPNIAMALNGRVTSNVAGAPGGSVWFYSPGGLIVGGTARFDVGNLVLSANDITSPLSDTSITFAAAAGSTAGVRIDPGAVIELARAGSYLAVVAPRVIQGGDVSINGSAAYVAAEQVEITINNGLFDIAVTQGTDGNGTDPVLEHRGSTVFTPNGSTVNPARAYVVAVPKNDAITMMVGGTLGYADAASIENGAIVLSAGGGVDVASGADSLTGPLNGQDATINITSGDFNAELRAFATTAINTRADIEETVRLAAGLDLITTGEISFVAENGGDILIGQLTSDGAADGRSEILGEAAAGIALSFTGPTSFEARDTVSITADGGSIAFNGNLEMLAEGIDGTSVSRLSALNGGTLFVDGDVYLSASSGEADSSVASIAGTAELFADGGTIDINGGIDIFAVGSGFGALDGAAVGGTARIHAVNGGSVTLGGDAILYALADAGTYTVGSVLYGGDAQGGDAEVSAGDGGAISFAGSLSMYASGDGRGGDEGGDGVGGSASLLAEGGSIEIGSDAYIDASASGGDGIIGGSATGGDVIVRAVGARLAVGTAGAGDLTLASFAFGGDVDGGDPGTGGNATGGTVTVESTAADSTPAEIEVASAMRLFGYALAGGMLCGEGCTLTPAIGGSAVGGTVDIDAGNSITAASLSITAYGTGGLGGFTFSGTAPGSGGDGTGGDVSIDMTAGAMTLAGLSVDTQGFGGDGGRSEVSSPEVAGGNGGSGVGGTINVRVMAADPIGTGVSTLGSVDLNATGRGGEGGVSNNQAAGNGGFGEGGTVEFYLFGEGTTNISGLGLYATGVGGVGGAADGFGASGSGGGAEGGLAKLDVAFGTLSASGTTEIHAAALGGDTSTETFVAGSESGGSVTGGTAELLVSGGTATFAAVDVVAEATAGDSQLGMAGGVLSAGTATVAASAGTLNVNGGLLLTAYARAGDGRTAPTDALIGGAANLVTATGGTINLLGAANQVYADVRAGSVSDGSSSSVAATGGTVQLGGEGLLTVSGTFLARADANGPLQGGSTPGTLTGGSVILNAPDGGTVSFGGATQLQARAFGSTGSTDTFSAAAGGDAFGGNISITLGSDASLTSTALLTLDAEARGGSGRYGGNNGSATGGQISIATDDGANFEALDLLVAALGTGGTAFEDGYGAIGGTGTGGTAQLDFSGATFQGTDLTVNLGGDGGAADVGGDANGGTLDLTLGDFTLTGTMAVTLDAAAANGRTAAGGNAVGGDMTLTATGGVASIEDLSVVTTGTAGGGAARSIAGEGHSGGEGRAGNVLIQAGTPSGRLELGAANIEAQGIGGAGGAVTEPNNLAGTNLGGLGGAGTSSSVTLRATAGSIETGNLTFSLSATGGAGGAAPAGNGGDGGYAQGGVLRLEASGGAGVQLTTEDASAVLTATGGAGGAGGTSGPGAGGNGGDATGGTVNLVVNQGALSHDRLDVIGSARGGAGGVGENPGEGGAGGSAQGAVVATFVTQGSFQALEAVLLTLDAVGGAGAELGIGGGAQGGSYSLAADNGTVTFSNVLTADASATGGLGGGNALGGTFSIQADNGTDLTGFGAITANASGTGGAAFADTAGSGTGGTAGISATNSSIFLTDNVTLRADATGLYVEPDFGVESVASAGMASLSADSGSSVLITGDLLLSANGVASEHPLPLGGGNADGADGTGGQATITASGAAIDVFGTATLTATGTGGAAAGAGVGGTGIGGTASITLGSSGDGFATFGGVVLNADGIVGPGSDAVGGTAEIFVDAGQLSAGSISLTAQPVSFPPPSGPEALQGDPSYDPALVTFDRSANDEDLVLVSEYGAAIDYDPYDTSGGPVELLPNGKTATFRFAGPQGDTDSHFVVNRVEGRQLDITGAVVAQTETSGGTVVGEGHVAFMGTEGVRVGNGASFAVGRVTLTTDASFLPEPPPVTGAFQGSPEVYEGDASFDRSPIEDIITIRDERTVIDWSPLDDAGYGSIDFLPEGLTATFRNDPNFTSNFVVLNRILPSDSSRQVLLNGTVRSELTSDGVNYARGGTVWFYSPGGILAGSTSVFDVGSLMLSSNAIDFGEGGLTDLSDGVSFGATSYGAAVVVEAGAQITAAEADETSYLLLVGSRVEQHGNVAVDDAAIYVAAEGATITLDDGVPSVVLTQGFDTSAGVILSHSGSTTGLGPDGAGSGGDPLSIVMVAAGGSESVGIDVTGSTLGFGGSGPALGNIVLSVGRNVAEGGIDYSEPAIGVGGTVNIDGGAVRSNLAAFASDEVSLGNSFGGLSVFTGSVALTSDQAARVRLNGGERLRVDGDLTVVARAGDGSLASVELYGSDLGLEVGGNLAILADVPDGENAEAGNALLVAQDDGEISNGIDLVIGDDLILSANARASSGSSAYAGRAEVDLGGNVSATVGNDLVIRADATLNGGDDAAFAEGGVADLRVTGEADLTVDAFTRVSAVGGDSEEAFSGSVAGGQAGITVDGSVTLAGGLSLVADANAGADSSSGNGGADAGLALIAIEGGTLTVGGPALISASASAARETFGGSANGGEASIRLNEGSGGLADFQNVSLVASAQSYSEGPASGGDAYVSVLDGTFTATGLAMSNEGGPSEPPSGLPGAIQADPSFDPELVSFDRQNDADYISVSEYGATIEYEPYDSGYGTDDFLPTGKSASFLFDGPAPEDRVLLVVNRVLQPNSSPVRISGNVVSGAEVSGSPNLGIGEVAFVSETGVTTQAGASFVVGRITLTTDTSYAPEPPPPPSTDGAFQGTPTVVSGGADFDRSLTEDIIWVRDERTVIDWVPTDDAGSGSIDFLPAGLTGTFRNNADTTSDFVVLNRILPSDTGRQIQLNGTIRSQLTSNGVDYARGGTVWFYSPGGILAGSTAVFDVGSLMLTSNAIALGSGNTLPGAGSFLTLTGTSGSGVTVQSGALISADGYAILAGSTVAQNGNVSAGGTAALLAGEGISLRPDGGFAYSITDASAGGAGTTLLSHGGVTSGGGSVVMAASGATGAARMSAGSSAALVVEITGDGAIRLGGGSIGGDASVIASSISLDGGIDVSGNAEIDSDTTISLAGSLQAADLTLLATDGVTGGGSLSAAGALEVSSGGSLLLGALSGSTIALEANGDITTGNVTAATAFTAIGDSFTFGAITAPGIALETGGTLSSGLLLIAGDATLSSGGAMTIAGADVGGDLLATTDATLTIGAVEAGSVSLAGATLSGSTIVSAGTVSLTSGGALSFGDVTAAGGLDASGGDFTFGAITVPEIALATTGFVTTGLLTTAGDVAVDATGPVTLAGVDADGDLVVTSDAALTLGAVDAASVSLTGATLQGGTIASAGAVTLVSAGALSFGDVVANGGLDASGSDFTFGAITAPDIALATSGFVTTGLLTTTGNVSVDAGGAVTIAGVDAGGALLASSDSTLFVGTIDAASVSLTAATLSGGTIGSAGAVSLTSAGAISFGDIVAGGGLDASGGDFTFGAITAPEIALATTGFITTGLLSAPGDVTLDAAGAISVAGVTSGGALRITGDSAFTLGNASAAGITLAAAAIDADALVASGAVQATTTAGTLAFASIDADSVSLVSVGSVAGGDVLARTSLSATGASLTFGNVTAPAITLATAGTISTGALAATNAISLDAGQTITVASADAGGDFVATSDTALDLGTVSAARITLAAATIDADALAADGSVDADASGALSVAALSANDADLRGGSVQIGAAIIAEGLSATASAGNLAVDNAQADNITLAATGAATIGQVTGTDVTLTAGTSITGGVAAATADLTLTAGTFIDMDSATAGGALLATSGGALAIGTVSGGTVSLTGARVQVTALTAQDDATLTATAGDIALGSAQAARLLLAATGAIDAGTLTATTSIAANAGGGIAIDTADAGTDFAATAGGIVTLASISAESITLNGLAVDAALLDAGGSLTIIAGDSIDLGTATGDSVSVVGRSLTGEELTVGGAFTATMSEQIDIGSLTAAAIDLTGATVTADALTSAGALGVSSTGGAVDLGTVAAGGTTTLASATTLDVDSITGPSIIANAQGAIRFGDVAGGTLIVGGPSLTLGRARLSGALLADLSGAIAIGDAQAGSITLDGASIAADRLAAIVLVDASSDQGPLSVQRLEAASATLASAGDLTIGSATGGDLSLAGATLALTSADLSGDLSADIAGPVAIGTTRAANIALAGTSLDAASLTATAGGIGFTGDGDITIGTATATGDIALSGATLVATRLAAGGDVAVRASGRATLAVLRAGRAIDVVATGDLDVDDAAAAGSIVLASANGSLVAGTAVIAANAASAVGPAGAQAAGLIEAPGSGGIVLEAGQDITVENNVTATGRLFVDAGGRAIFLGTATGSSVEILSADVQVAPTARIGSGLATSGVRFVNTSAGRTFIGGTSGQPGYQLSDPELDRVQARTITIVGPAVGTDPNRAPDVLVDTLSLGAALPDGSGNLFGDGSVLRIETPGIVRFVGLATLTNLDIDDRFEVTGTERIEAVVPDGGILMTGSNGVRSGRLILTSNRVLFATSDAANDLPNLGTIGERQDRLGQSDGLVNPEGYLSANAIEFRVRDALYIQNVGGIRSAARAGFTTGPDGFVVNSTGTAPAEVIINGRQATANGGFVVGGGLYEGIGGSAPGSSANGCAVSGALCELSGMSLSMVELTGDQIEDQVDEEEREKAAFRPRTAPIVEIAGFSSLSVAPSIDTPVTGAGNEDLWISE